MDVFENRFSGTIMKYLRWSSTLVAHMRQCNTDVTLNLSSRCAFIQNGSPPFQFGLAQIRV